MAGATIDLWSMLRSALIHHGIKLDDPPMRDETESAPDPTVSYISRMLLEDDDDDDQELARSGEFRGILDELTAIVSQSRSPPSKRDGDRKDVQGLLVQCAHAVAVANSSQAFRLMHQIKDALAQSSTSTLNRTVSFFVEAFTARLGGFGPQACAAMDKEVTQKQYLMIRLLNPPCSTLSHFFANESILELTKGAHRLHIVDYGIQYGFQWPSLIKALSQRPGGAPQLKITGVDFPQVVDLCETGRRLVEYANSCGFSLEFMPVATEFWERGSIIRCDNEVLVVNSVLRLRHLREEGSVALDNPREVFFEKVYSLKPDLFVQADVSSNTNAPFFMPRFSEAFEFYKRKMEYFEAVLQGNPEEHRLVEKMAARDIMNIIACEGLDRVERATPYGVWDAQARRAGFESVHLSDEIYGTLRRACGQFKNPNFGVTRDKNWILIGWKGVVLYAVSAWRQQCLIEPGRYRVLPMKRERGGAQQQRQWH